jgi:hypothetical protein
MIFKETKFAYRHKPTGKWVLLETPHKFKSLVECCLVDDFVYACLYRAKNIIEEDLIRSMINGEEYAAQNFLEFELVEVEIEYRVKQ